MRQITQFGSAKWKTEWTSQANRACKLWPHLLRRSARLSPEVPDLVTTLVEPRPEPFLIHRGQLMHTADINRSAPHLRLVQRGVQHRLSRLRRRPRMRQHRCPGNPRHQRPLQWRQRAARPGRRPIRRNVLEITSNQSQKMSAIVDFLDCFVN